MPYARGPASVGGVLARSSENTAKARVLFVTVMSESSNDRDEVKDNVLRVMIQVSEMVNNAVEASRHVMESASPYQW